MYQIPARRRPFQQQTVVVKTQLDFAEFSYTVLHSAVRVPSDAFRPSRCLDPTLIGSTCSITNDVCTMLQPCRNNGSCQNTTSTPFGYKCRCATGFSGATCQIDQRLCRPDTCLYQGNRHYIIARTIELSLVFLQACVKKCPTPPSSAAAVRVGKVTIANCWSIVVAMSRVRIAACVDHQCSGTGVNVWVIATLVSTVRSNRVER